MKGCFSAVRYTPASAPPIQQSVDRILAAEETKRSGQPQVAPKRTVNPEAWPSKSTFDGLDDFLRGIVEIVRRQHVEATLPDDLLAGIDIGAFEPHHQRHRQSGFLHRGNHALGDDVAFHDAAE